MTFLNDGGVETVAGKRAGRRSAPTAEMRSLWEGAQLATNDDAVNLSDRIAPGRRQARSYS